MKYSQSHEWLEVVDNQTAIVGITSYAQEELGEIVYVELPEVGDKAIYNEPIVVLESTKAAADVYSPVTGIIVEVNSQLKECPYLINQSPEGKGWLYKIQLLLPAELDALMTLDGYRQWIGMDNLTDTVNPNAFNPA